MYNEHKIQVACVRWFRYQFPEYIIFHIPNERKQSPTAGARFKTLGVLAGVPDLFVPVARHGFNGLFIEIKHGKNILTENQKIVISKLKSQDYQVAVCYSFDDFEMVINIYFS
jgi:hypothetical protein